MLCSALGKDDDPAHPMESLLPHLLGLEKGVDMIAIEEAETEDFSGITKRRSIDQT